MRGSLQRRAVNALASGSMTVLEPETPRWFEAALGNAGFSASGTLDYVEIEFKLEHGAELRITTTRRGYEHRGAGLASTLRGEPKLSGEPPGRSENSGHGGSAASASSAIWLDSQAVSGELTFLDDGEWQFETPGSAPAVVIGRGVDPSRVVLRSVREPRPFSERIQVPASPSSGAAAPADAAALAAAIEAAVDASQRMYDAKNVQAEDRAGAWRETVESLPDLSLLRQLSDDALSSVNHAVTLAREAPWFLQWRRQAVAEIVQWYATGKADAPAAHEWWQRIRRLEREPGTTEDLVADFEEAIDNWRTSWRAWLARTEASVAPGEASQSRGPYFAR